MLRKVSFLIVLMAAVALPGHGDFAFGFQFFMPSRDLDTGSLTLDSDRGDDLAVFMGFDVGNSMFYLQYHEEDTGFAEDIRYQKDEFSLDWHWNETTSKNNFKNTSFGIFTTSYDIGPGVQADFFGLSGGGGFAHFLNRVVFINARAKVRWVFAEEEDLFFTTDPDAQDQTSFLGLEAQVALGFQLGKSSSWSMQIGYKWQDMDFKGRFVDDSSTSLFGTMRFFVPTGQ